MNRAIREKVDAHNFELARKCLALIRDIADRGALSWDPEDVGYALQELSQVLLERTGSEERVFEPIPAGEINDLDQLYQELVFVDGFMQDAARPQRCN